MGGGFQVGVWVGVSWFPSDGKLPKHCETIREQPLQVLLQCTGPSRSSAGYIPGHTKEAGLQLAHPLVRGCVFQKWAKPYLPSHKLLL